MCTGAGTAMLGREAAMACTVAVEETVVEHYNRSNYFCALLYNLLELPNSGHLWDRCFAHSSEVVSMHNYLPVNKTRICTLTAL